MQIRIHNTEQNNKNLWLKVMKSKQNSKNTVLKRKILSKIAKKMSFKAIKLKRISEKQILKRVGQSKVMKQGSFALMRKVRSEIADPDQQPCKDLTFNYFSQFYPLSINQ
jgi:hypothetical protein